MSGICFKLNVLQSEWRTVFVNAAELIFFSEIWNLKKKKTLFTHDCEFSLCTNIFRKMTPVKHWVLHSWPNWFLFFSVLCFKINPAVRQTHFFFPPSPFSTATPKTRLEGKLISLLGCCLINFLFEGCPVWCLWCLPPVHSWFEI